MKRVLVYSGTLGPNKNKNKIFVIKFENPTLISAVSIVPHGRQMHKSQNSKSKTFPAIFEFSIYACDINRPRLSAYQKIGFLQNSSVILQHKFFTKHILFRGTFEYISINLYEDAHSLVENLPFHNLDFDDKIEIPATNSPRANTARDPKSVPDLSTDNIFKLNDICEIDTDSDSLMIDDFDIDQVLIHDFSVTEETWLTQATQINPHQLLLTGVYYIKNPGLIKRDFSRKCGDKNQFTTFDAMIELLTTEIHEKRWLFTLEEVIPILHDCLNEIVNKKNQKFEETVMVLYDKCKWGFNKDVWLNLPAFLNFRILKTAFKLFNLIIDFNEARQLLNMRECVYMLSSLASDLKEYSSMSRYLLECNTKIK